MPQGCAPIATPQPERSDDDLLTRAELAKYLTVHERTVRRMEADGEVPQPLWLGGQARWLWRDVKDWIHALSVLSRLTPKAIAREKEGQTETEPDNAGQSGTNAKSSRKSASEKEN